MAEAAFAGVVLAGGASSRMGRDKAALLLDGVSLLQRATTLLRRAGADPVLVAGRDGDAGFVPDRIPRRGPLGGLDAVLAGWPQLAGRMLLLIPVDMPRLDVGALIALVEAGAADGAGAAYRGSPLPLALRCTDALREAVERRLDTGSDWSLAGLIGELGVVRIDAAPGVVLDNINTPAEWRSVAGATTAPDPQ
jgi:molybdenum cofactor guanylyltransferase